MHRPTKVCRKVQQFSIFLVLFGIPLPLLVDTKRKTKPKINCFEYSSTIYYEFLGSLSSGQGDLEKWNMFLFDLFLHLPSSVLSNSANFFVTPNLIRRQHYLGCSTSEQNNRIEKKYPLKFLASIFFLTRTAVQWKQINQLFNRHFVHLLKDLLWIISRWRMSEKKGLAIRVKAGTFQENIWSERLIERIILWR